MAGVTKPRSQKKTVGKKTAAKRSSVKETVRKKTVAKKPSAPATAKPRARKAAKVAVGKDLEEGKPLAPMPRVIAETTRRMVAAAAEACDEKKAENTRILELDALDAGFTDFFLITSGTNERQTQSIADEIEMRMKREFATYANSVEGKRQGEWILLDYVDFVVHIFLAEKRAFYDIERLRKSARTVDTAELQKTLKQKTATTRKRIAAR